MSDRGDIYLTNNGARAELTLNRPAKRNALTLAMWAAVPALLENIASDEKIRALLVRGEGGVFAAGADIEEFDTTYATREAALANQKTMSAAMRALEEFPKPTIAMIEGACVGGGCGLALCCDLRFAADDARFGITPAKLGLAYGVADTRRLVDAVGRSMAKDILFTGRLMDAGEALKIGLVDRVFPAAALPGETERFFDMLAGASSYTARATKQVMRMLSAGATDDNAESRALFADAFSGADFQEGARAFRAKRPPRFTS